MLNEYKPTLVLMAGLPGAGKTTLARELGRALNWTILDKDWLKLAFLQAQPGMAEEEVGRITYELIFSLAEHILVYQQLPVILDTATLYPFILERASQIAYAASGLMKIVLCRASSNLRRERLKQRIAADLPHPFMGPLETANIAHDLDHFAHLPTDICIVETDYAFEGYFQRVMQYVSASEQQAELLASDVNSLNKSKY